MKLIVVAAGQGTRLRPLTDTIPKCMVPFRGKPIINHILDTARSCGIDEIGVVHGYRGDVLKQHLKDQNVQFFENPHFATTNMVASLFCARKFLKGPAVISYGDIVYGPSILNALCQSPAPLAVAVDQLWHQLWQLRMEDPLQDAETLKLNASGHILELGKKPGSLADIQGQYMGLIKCESDALATMIEFYDQLDRQAPYDGKNFDNMYMTTFLQHIIDELQPVKAVLVKGNWVEIDSLEDLNAYQHHGVVVET